jgi:hypothetical protein
MAKQLSKKVLSLVFGGFVALGALTGIACDDDNDNNIPVTTGNGGHGGSTTGHGGSGGSTTGFGGSGGSAGFAGGGGGHAGTAGAHDGGSIY